MPSINFWLYSAVPLIVTCLAVLFRPRKPALNLPPGPPGEFLVGHLRVMPKTFMWNTYEKWAKTFGDIMFLRIFSQGFLVLTSVDAAKELLEQQSKVASDRPHFTMLSDLMRFDWAIQFQSMGPRFRQFRKMVQACVHPKVFPIYNEIVDKETSVVLKGLINNPPHKLDELQHTCSSLVMTLLYGKRDEETTDEYVHIAEAAIDGLLEAGNVGKFIVDLFPFLQYLPSWFPGTEFQRKAETWRKLGRKMIEVPYNKTKELYDRGMATPSVVKLMLDMGAEDDEKIDPEVIMGAAGVFFIGAADTALSAVFSFVYAMVLYPEVQAKIHTEIQAQIGDKRLPSLEDRASLKYFEHVFTEVFRWSPAVPLSVPHCISEDCTLRGYHVPKGTVVFVNQWAILRDETTYKDPQTFNPDRYAPTDGSEPAPDPRVASFGYGRRVCPGKQFADPFLWVIMVRLVAAFSFSKACGRDGKPIEPPGEYLSSMITRPLDFPFELAPRSANMAELIQKL